MSRNLIFNTEFKNFIIPGNFQEFSGTLDIAWNWSNFCQFWHIGHKFHLIFVTELEFGLNNWKMPNSRLFLESWNQNPRITRDDSKNMTVFNNQGQIQVQWQKLSGIDAQYVKIGKKLANSRRYPEFQKIPGSFQEWWNF